MTVDLPAAAWTALGATIGVGTAAVAWRLAAARRKRTARALAQGMRRGERLESAAEVFETALILIDGAKVDLIAGREGLAACADVLGLDKADVESVLAAIVGLDPEYRRRFEALATRGEAIALRIRGPNGGVQIEGRTAGALAWIRLSPAPQADVAGPDAASLAALIDSQGDPAWIATAHGAPAWAGRAWLEAVGAESVQEARAKATGLDRMADALVREAATAGAPRRSLQWVQTARGRRAMQIVATPLVAGGVAAWARDVTDVETARELARRDAALHAQVLTHTGDAVAVFDSLRRLVFHNPAFADLWDLEPAWLAERPNHGEILDRLRQARRLPETVDYARFKAGELAGHQQVDPYSEAVWRLPAERTLRVARLPHPGGGLTLIFSDITPELRLKTQFNHLIQVQRATLDKLTDAVAVFGADGRLRLHNEAFERFWAIAPSQLTRAADFDGVVELCVPRLHDRQFWRDLKARITDPDPVARAATQGEVVTAEQRIVAYQSRPLPDGATLIGFSDITDTRRLEEALRDREAALAEADRLKRAFVGSVSYELRTPLTTIIGYAELLERTGVMLADRERGYIAAVLAAARHLAGSIDDVLETAEIDAGESVLDITDVDVDRLLRDAAARRLDDALRAQVTLEVAADAKVGLIGGDGPRLAQVLDHLIGNALEQTPAGGSVVLSASRGQGEVRLSVADNGRGFPFDVQAHIFDRFSHQNRGGPGLGLALVKALVELHGGWVALESEPGAGATFTCHLPELAQAPDTRPRLF